MRTLLALLLCVAAAFATEIIDGVNPPNPAKFNWNATTKTATQLVDLTETVRITGAGVTLDGAGHSINGAGETYGVRVDAGLQNVNVVNCTVSGFNNSIAVLDNTTDSTVENCTVDKLIVLNRFNHDCVVRDNDGAIKVVLADRSLIENNTIAAGAVSIGIEIALGNNHVIRGNTINGRTTGIRMPSSNGSLIENNVLFGNGEAVFVQGCDDTTIKGNQISGSFNQYGIHVQQGCDNALIEDNHVTTSASIGIRFSDGLAPAVRNNTATNNGSTGISVAFATNAVVTGNTADGNGGFGLSCGGSNNTVSGNSSDGNAAGGFSMGSGADSVLENNTATNNGNLGIYYGGTRCVFQDNFVQGNNGGIGTSAGAPPEDVKVLRNTVKDNIGGGIAVWQGVILVEDNTISGSTATSSTNGWGIHLTGGPSGVMIRGNHILDNEGHGIGFGSGPSNNTVTRNVVTGNGTFSIYLPGGFDNLIYDNLFDSAGMAGGFSSSTGANTWNVAQTAGPNIVGGPYIGGNFWGTTADDGFSETCTDANGDGFCDQPFQIDGNNVDNLPLVLNTPPSCNPSGAGVYELGATITLGGTVADNDGDLVTFEWRDGATVLFSGAVQTPVGGAPVALPSFSPALGLGVHSLTLVVDDGHVLDPVTCDVIIEVIDTTDPTLAPISDCSMLWPPNHQMVTCAIQANASDNDGLPPTLGVTVTSNEPDDGLGDGDTPNDIQGLAWDSATGVITIDLRAERAGVGTGRVYTITITATDGAGNASMTSLTVLVPRSKGQGGN